MNPYYQAKHFVKLFRWQYRRAMTALRWGSSNLTNAPIIFGNAMPKSGSHLIIQVLQGLIHIGPFVDPGFPPANRSEDNRKLPNQAILANIQRMQPGDIGYGYVHADQSFIDTLTRRGRMTIFVYRDPRDMIVSHVFYATDIHKGHGMNPYYTKVLKSVEERINAQILGVNEPGFELSSVKTKYQAYLGWLEVPEVLHLRFEDLILNQEATLKVILKHLALHGYTPKIPLETAIEILQRSVEPRRSGTFRKGKPGNWRDHFTPGNIANFKRTTGDLLIRLGYEQDGNW
jgi:hypothetical protein